MENVLNKDNGRQHEAGYYSQDNIDSEIKEDRFYIVEERKDETERMMVSLTNEQINALSEARKLDKLVYGLNNKEDETFQKLLDIQKTHNWELVKIGDKQAKLVDDKIEISNNQVIFIVKNIRVDLNLLEILIDLEYRNLKAVEILDERNFKKIEYSRSEIDRLKEVKDELLRKGKN